MRRALRLFAALIFAILPALTAPAQASAENWHPFQGRWIDVNLATYTAIAMEGTTPVFSALITAGKPKYETPLGTFYIQYRVERETMSSETLGVPRDAPEGYYLKDVMYAQYFTWDGVAIHGNYWQSDWVFGKVNTSHACVGMRNADAARFWSFADVGTPVVIHSDPSPVVTPKPTEEAKPTPTPAPTPKAIPSVVGKPVADAKTALEAAGFTVETFEQVVGPDQTGKVLTQEPAGGEAMPGSKVKLVVGKTPPKPVLPAVKPPDGNRAWMPAVVGLPEAEARARVEQAGLQNSYTNYQAESDVSDGGKAVYQNTAPGAVISSNPAAGAELFKGTKVNLAVRKP